MPISTITVQIPGISGPAGEYTPVTGEDDMIYGVRWDTVNDIVEPGVLINGSFVASDYQNFPVQEQMQRGLLTGAGAFSPLLASGGAYLADGTAADLSGAAGQCMVQIPRCYTKKWRSGNYMYYMLSRAAFSGAVVDPAFRDQAYRYYSAFEGTLFQSGSLQTDGGGGTGGASSSADKLYSAIGAKPWTYETRSMFRALAGNTGDVFHQLDNDLTELLTLLYLTRFKSWNSQEMLPGYTEESSWDYSKVMATGLTLGLGNTCGSIYDTTGMCVANSFYGIENLYGHVWKFTDGINVEWAGDPLLGRIYTCSDPDDFADDTTVGYTDSGLDFPTTTDFVKALHDGTFYAQTTGDGADSETWLTDKFYASSSAGWRVVYVGGFLSIGADAGVGSRNASIDSAICSSSLGGRLAA